jgi:hypothetical protein
LPTRLTDVELIEAAHGMRAALDALPPPTSREKPSRQRLEGSWLATALIAGVDPFADLPDAPHNADTVAAAVALILRPRAAVSR